MKKVCSASQAWLAGACLPLAAAQSAYAHDVRLDYRADGFDVVSGRTPGAVGVDVEGLGADGDLDEAFGWRGASASFTIIHSNGGRTNDKTGALEPISAVEIGDSATRLYEAWLEAPVGATSVKAGVIDLNTEFDSSDLRAVFLNAAEPIGPDLANSGQAGPSVFPITGLGVRVKSTFGAWTLHAAVADGRPGDPNHSKAFTSLKLSDQEGALVIGEIKRAPEKGLLASLGAWAYTASFDKQPTSATSPLVRGQGNVGVYGNLENALPAPSGALRGFLRVGAADPRFNRVANYVGAGLVWTGPIRQRPDDALGLAFASSGLSRATQFGVAQRGDAPATREQSLELTYNAPVSKWASIQPTVEYVIDPGGDKTTANALAVGARLHITLMWSSQSAKP